MSRGRQIAAGVAALALLAGIAVLAGGGAPSGGRPQLFGDALADPVPYDGRSPALTPQDEERVLVELPRPALGATARVTAPASRQRAYVASLHEEADALISALGARGVKLRHVVTFERTWHGFAATLRARDLGALQSLGVRVRANRRFFPAFSQPIPAAGPPTPAPTGQRVTLLAGGVPGRADPRDPERREVGGEPLAAALRALGVGVRALRVSSLSDGEEYARTDTLLEGLEHTVDPDGDGDTSDHDRVALIGVSAPYAGFADAPEAAAVRAAKRIGTTVVAPVGEEGPAAGAYGTVGSPGASTGALAVAPLSSPAAVARTSLRIGNTTVTGAAVLAGTPFDGELRTIRPPDANTASALLVAGTRLTGRLAVMEAGDNPGARAAAASGAGAAAVVLAEPRDGHPLPTLPAGRVDVPVLGVTGAAARAVLGLGETTARADGLRAPRPPFATGTLSRFASVGPAYDGTPKPDLSRPGTIIASGELISGSAVAAARVAADAARGLDVEPRPDTAAPTPAPAPDVSVEGVSVAGRTVSFTIGGFTRGDPAAGSPGTAVVPADRLDLTLTRADSEAVVERLTPPGGDRGVLPGAYAFTVPRAVMRSLPAGDYVFRVSASAPRQTTPTTAVSPSFTK